MTERALLRDRCGFDLHYPSCHYHRNSRRSDVRQCSATGCGKAKRLGCADAQSSRPLWGYSDRVVGIVVHERV